MDKKRMLPEKAINEFLDIYKRKFGEELSFDEAEIKANDFINLFSFLTEGRKNENEKLYDNSKRTA